LNNEFYPKPTALSEITLPFHLAIPALLCLAALMAMAVFRHRLFGANRRFWVSAAAFFAVYLLITGAATLTDIWYQWDVHRYDLDQDGFFDAHETTEAQKAALFRLTNDLGRNLSFVTGFVFALVIAGAVYFLVPKPDLEEK
jgi:hypothetical protein